MHLGSLIPAVLAALFGLTGAARGQVVAGEVRGFDDRLAAGVVVRVFDDDSNRLGEVLTDQQGRFEWLGDRAVGAIEIQHEGVVVVQSIANGGEPAVRASFAGAKYFTLRGHVVDPAGAPAAGIDFICRNTFGRAITTVTTDARGAFLVRCDRPVADLLVDPLGWAHVEEGPFAQDRGIAVDLRLVRDRYFALRGNVLDEAGAPVPLARVEGVDQGRRVAGTQSDRDGHFVLWANREVGELVATQGAPFVRRKGPWQSDAAVDLDVRVHGYVLVTGRVVDARGRGLGQAMLFAVDQQTPPAAKAQPIGSTDGSGNFRLLVPRGTAFLWAHRDGGEHQVFAPMPKNGEPIEMRSDH